MSAEIVKIYPPGSAKNPDSVLEQAIGEYESVFIVGYDKEGNLSARASLNIECSDVLWLIEMFKMKMLRGDYYKEDEE